MEDRRIFEPKTPEKFQRLVESGEELIIAGAGQEGSIKFAEGKLVSDDVYMWGESAVRSRVDHSGKPYGRAYMLVKDKFGLMYLLKHRIQLSSSGKHYESICRAYDVVSEEELGLYEKLCRRHCWRAPSIEPIEIFSGRKEIKDFGRLWLLANHYTRVTHKVNKLKVPDNIECPLQSLNPDAYLDFFSTEQNAYGRGIATNTMNAMEGIIARLQPHKPNIKFIGSMEPLDYDQVYKRKIGASDLEMIDEYGKRHMNDAYCAIASVYQKLGFTVTAMTGLNAGMGKRYTPSRATVIQKELNPDEILKAPDKEVSQHFANPLDFPNDELE
ncbi:MAG: hypothetical protein J6J23_04580 [Clostridia bacterium]|nr:hypothetical protein [Clostridia bacterium]